MATAPNYAATPRASFVVISTANTARDGTGTLGTVFTAGSNGSRIDRIIAHATGTTTAGMVRLFVHDGTNARLWRELPVTAVTPSASVPAWSAEVVFPSNTPLILPSGWSLRASTHNAESFAVTAFGADY